MDAKITTMGRCAYITIIGVVFGLPCWQHRREVRINTKQQAWQVAKECGLDEFITKVAKSFPDAIDGVRIDTPSKMIWHMQSKEKPR